MTEEQISGSVATSERPGFARLRDRMENGDVLIVTRSDRLGRDAMHVRKTVEQPARSGIRVHCLALGGADLTSAAGKMTMQAISAGAEFEKDLLIEHARSGLVITRAAGKRFGRPPALSHEQQQAAREKLQAGVSISTVARQFGTSRQTNMHLRDDTVGTEWPERRGARQHRYGALGQSRFTSPKCQR